MSTQVNRKDMHHIVQHAIQQLILCIANQICKIELVKLFSKSVTLPQYYLVIKFLQFELIEMILSNHALC